MPDLKTIKVQMNYNNIRKLFLSPEQKNMPTCLSNKGYFCEQLLLLHYTE